MRRSPQKSPRRPLRALLFAAMAFTSVLSVLPACRNQASCEAVCSNFQDKCGGDDKNSCLEECKREIDPIPTRCNVERDDVLSCLSEADSLECSRPSASIGCKDEETALAKCTSSGSGGSGGGTTTTTSSSGGSTVASSSASSGGGAPPDAGTTSSSSGGASSSGGSSSSGSGAGKPTPPRH